MCEVEEEEETEEEGLLQLGAVTTSSVQKREQFVPDLEGTSECVPPTKNCNKTSLSDFAVLLHHFQLCFVFFFV